jgi:RHS repeat-associated protein
VTDHFTKVASMRLVLALSLAFVAAPVWAVVPRSAHERSPRTLRERTEPTSELFGRPPSTFRSTIDWETVRERTRRYEAQARANELLLPDPVLAPRGRALLARAQSLLGAVPTGLARLHFPWAPTEEQSRALADAVETVSSLDRELMAGVANAREALAFQQQRLKNAPAQSGRIEAERRVLAERSAATSEVLASIRERLEQRRGGIASRLRYWVAQIRGVGAPALAAQLAHSIEEWGGSRPVLGAELTYVRGALQGKSLPSGEITPAYAIGDSTLQLEDTTVGREVEQTSEIAARAAELRTPAAAYEFVKNEFRLDWYYGSLKGSGETFRERRGNDADLASVLIALLRAEGVAARYVRGTIEMPVGRLAELMGLLTADQIEALAAGAPLPSLASDRALAALPAAGIPFQPVVSGGALRAVRFVHTWVEAYLPYGNYRGRGAGTGAKSWVALDPAIPGGTKYVSQPAQVDALAVTSLSASLLTQEYLESATTVSPLAFVRERVGDALVSAGSTYAAALRTVTSRAESLGFVPGALPYTVVAVHGEWAFLPDDAKHRLRFIVSDAAGTVVEQVLPLHRVIGHRTVFAWDPATPADSDAIVASGGLYEAPASAVQLLPVLRVDGHVEATGTRSAGLGAQASWRLELLLPDGSSRVIDNHVVVGNVVAIGLGGPGNAYVEPADDAAGWQDGPAPRFLYARAAEYASRWTDAEEELSRLLQIVPLRPTASVVLVENQLAVDEVLGVRRRVVWKGLQVDADHRTMVPLELVSGRDKELLRLSGLHGSYLEAEVLRGGTGVEAVAAVSVLQEANRRGASVLTITAANSADALSRLVTSAEVRREVEDQVARGREVTIPATDLTISDWTGTGFVARDPRTEEAAYFLSGVVSGGQTIISPASWTDQTLVERLSRPDAPMATVDTSRIGRIVLIPGPVQEVTVGETAKQPMTVVVTTMEGAPVVGAEVRFRSVGQANPLLAPAPAGPRSASTLTVRTDSSGKARAWVTPDTDIGAEAIVRKGNPNEEVVGLDRIMAEASGPGTPTIVLPNPWSVLAHHGEPSRIDMPCSLVSWFDNAAVLENSCIKSGWSGLELSEPIYAQVRDRFGNWVSNTAVEWSSATGSGRFVPVRNDADSARVLDPQDSSQRVSTTIATSTEGIVYAAYIPGLQQGTWNGFRGEVLYARAGSVLGRLAFTTGVPSDPTTAGVHADQIAFRLRQPMNEDNAGVYGARWPRPIGFQFFRWTGTTWQVIGGADPGFHAEVQMDTYQVASTTQTLLYSEIVDPASTGTLATGPWVAFDDSRTAVFWPRYDVDGGSEGWVFHGRFRLEDGNTYRTRSYGWNAESRRAIVETLRVLPGWVQTTTDEFGSASSDDLAVVFRVSNPAVYPVYVRIMQEPRTSGQTLVVLPSPGEAPRHPDDPTLLRVLPKGQNPGMGDQSTTTSFVLPLTHGTNGGKLRLQMLVPNGKDGSMDVLNWAERPIRIEPPGTSIAAPDQALKATAIIVVRNFESSATPPAGEPGPDTSTEPPVLIPAPVAFRVRGNGNLRITMGDTEVAAARVEADQDGNATTLEVVRSTIPILRREDGSIRLSIPPSDPSVHDVTLTFNDKTVVMPFMTEVVDASPLPIGHTFVKDVSVVDGHIQKSFTDISIPGRNGGLTFTRSYTSRGLDAVTPLGAGWTHSYRSFVTRYVASGRIRWMVVGGEGGGQMFDCGLSSTCRPQRGHHGQLRFDAPSPGSPGGQTVIYVARSGTEYRYTRRRTDDLSQERVWLTSIVDPRGNETYLEYADASYEGELLRVFEPGNRRLLQFAYDWPAASPHPALKSVSLLSSPSGTRTPPDNGFPNIDEPGVCVAFEQDEIRNLRSVKRYDGPCSEGARVLRGEGYGYLGGWNRALRSNLTSYTDPNGRTTSYVYYGNDSGGPLIPGTPNYLHLADLDERVWQVREPSPGGGTTRFEYSLLPDQVSLFGHTRPLFKTVVRSARAGADATTYLLDSYGASSKVIRGGSVRTTLWDPVHIRPVMETDPRGRTVVMSYDERGNLIARRTTTTPLGAAGDVPATEPLLDKDGNLVASIVERWAYDPDFGGETCRIDAEGRVTTTTYAEGLPIERREYAGSIDPSAATSSCTQLLSRASQTARDRVTQFAYCGVPSGASCAAANAARGDLVSSSDGPRLGSGRALGTRQNAVARYDIHGYPEVTRLTMGGSTDVTTTRMHDSRGRITVETDTLGHEQQHGYDGLDRVQWSRRINSRGTSPGEYRTFGYYAGGQLLSESLGATADPATIRWSRTVTLDGLNLPEIATETVATAGGPRQFTTITRHDQAGNIWQTVDRRGVRKTTYFDGLDRPLNVQVDVENSDVFAAGHGETPASFGTGPKTIASFTYDPAGNKLSETDVHGHTTRFMIDPLYRTVGVVAPEVPAGLPGSGATVQWLVQRRFDLVGNKVREVENVPLTRRTDGQVTSWTYDHANRVVESVDPIGRFERRTYDGLGEIDTVTRGYRAANEVVHFTSASKGYDALGRSFGVTEMIADLDGARTTETDLSYDDADHAAFERDRRGAVTRRRLDDLDRVYEETADVTGAPLSRRGVALTFPALALTTGYEYDAAGRRTATIDPLGRRTEDSYDGLGRLERRNLPMAVSETTLYDGEGNAVARTDRRGVTTTSSFDPLGREISRKLVESITRNGGELTFLTRQYWDSPGGSDGVTRTIEIDARGNSITHHVDALHREVRTSDAAGHNTLTWYDAKQRRGVQDPKGYVTEFDQDGAGRPTAQREKVSATATTTTTTWSQSWAYDEEARTETSTDRAGIVSVTTRDGVGRVRTVRRGVAPLLSVQTSSYDEGGNSIRVDDPNGHVTTFAYDGAGRKRGETRGFGSASASTTSFSYDAAGNRLTTKGPRGTWEFDVRETYDDLNRSVRTEVPTGDSQNPTIAVTSRAFDGAGNKLCERRPLGGDPLAAGGATGMSIAQVEQTVCGGAGEAPVSQGTRFIYEEFSKLTSVIDAAGGEHSFVYDEARNLIAKQDANRNLTVYGYDVLNRRTDEWQHLDAHGRVRTRAEVAAVSDNGFGNAENATGAFEWHVGYDANGNPETRRDPRGIVVTSTFGLLNRLETVTYPDDPGLRPAYPFPLTTAYAYDGNGNVDLVTEVKRIDPSTITTQVTDHDYDPTLGRLVRETRYDGKVVAYEYDAKGNRKKVRDPDGVETSYDYDAQDRLITVTTPAGQASYRHWPDGLLKGTSLPSGLEEARCYDPVGRVTAIVTARATIADTCPNPANMVSRFDYGYDANGNRTRQLERRTDPASLAIGTAEETRYGYDTLDRLVGVGYPDRTVLYQLDAVGNRVGERVVPASGTLALTVASYTSASSGLTTDLVATFNRVDWLVSQTDAVDATRNATYGYDSAGNLTDKVKGATVRQLRWSYRNTLTAVLQGPSSTQLAEVGRYDYDANLQRLSRTTAAENVEYVLDDRHVLQEASGAAGHPSYRRYHYGSGPLLVEDGGTRRFISTDALGSTTDLTTTGATVASMRKYDAWGQYRNDTAPVANEPKLGFTGHQYDPETGLVYARARYYDPDLGRFLSRDSVEGTIADAPSLHRFMYVRGNPLRYTDPSGNSDTAADAARRWEAQRAEYHKWLAAQLTPNDSLAKQTGLALTTLSVELGAGMMELFKLGEGAAEGGWRGWGKDALRAASLALLMKGSARMAKEPAPEPSPQGGRPPPAQAKVVEEPAGPAGDAVGTPTPPEPAPGRPAWGSVGAARASDPFDPEPATPPSAPPRPAAPEPGPAPGGKAPLPDDALVCRGGTCTAERFATGSGVKVGPDGKLSGVSVNSAPGAPLEEVTKGIPNKQVGVTTVGEIKAAGGEVTPAPTARNPIHAEVKGITAEQAEELFTPTVPNPSAR